MARLALEFLGSGGAVRTPRPACTCNLCITARRVGVPWARGGPSILVHGPDVLIDTPEDIYFQLDRSAVGPIAAGFYSHWHPDHTAGQRVWETRNADFLTWPHRSRSTPIYLPPQVIRDFESFGLMSAMRYKERRGWVTVQEFVEPLELGGWRITAHQLAEEIAYAFLFTAVDDGRRVLIVMDELRGWAPPADLWGVDLAVLPKGFFEFDPFHGDRWIAAEHPLLRMEATFDETLAIAGQLAPQRLVFSHIEEPDRLTPDEYARLAGELGAQRGWDVTFAHDTLVIQF